MLDGLVERGTTFDAAITIWVLQHCLNPGQDLSRIKRALPPQGKLFVMNNIHPAVPTREAGWANDGIDLRLELGREFTLLADGTQPRSTPPLVSPKIAFGRRFKPCNQGA